MLSWITISQLIINKEISYDKITVNKIIPKFTISNLYMLMYVSFRSEIAGAAYFLGPYYRPNPYFWKGTYIFKCP
jgi:hypothetical protein